MKSNQPKNSHLAFPLFILLATDNQDVQVLLNLATHIPPAMEIWKFQSKMYCRQSIQVRVTVGSKFRGMPIFKYYLHRFRTNQEHPQFCLFLLIRMFIGNNASPYFSYVAYTGKQIQ